MSKHGNKKNGKKNGRQKYKKQLKVYYDYVNQTFKLKTKCYLYSILGGTLQEINF